MTLQRKQEQTGWPPNLYVCAPNTVGVWIVAFFWQSHAVCKLYCISPFAPRYRPADWGIWPHFRFDVILFQHLLQEIQKCILSGFRKFLSRVAHTILLSKIRDRVITGNPHNGIAVPLAGQGLELCQGKNSASATVYIRVQSIIEDHSFKQT
jgi:hypothetical protein